MNQLELCDSWNMLTSFKISNIVILNKTTTHLRLHIASSSNVYFFNENL